jgi:chromosome segregation protein
VTVLKLRKVDIVGFKSFCERTTVTFSGAGITCIVGPNGCGKSNVVDAISWVLGEQSHKSLRAERMADCIFNGTTKRPPLGLAEVTITLEDPELAEAARFVLESQTTEGDSIALSDSSSSSGEIHSLSLATAENPDAEVLSDASAEITAADSIEGAPVTGLEKLKRRKREKSELQTKPGEVVVSRRLYRSGQSEYLINGRIARLRDIQEMFMGVGLGPDSYAIIEQGRIGLILSTKPMERRAIIEEAAGITKFKTKKRLSEAKLESSKENLNRVNDIVVEVEKQLGSLKRQASKARRYAEVREQMRGIVRIMLASKARELEAEAERLAARHDELLRSETERASGLQEQELEQDRLNQRIYELDAEIRQSQNHLGLTTLELDRAENRLAFNLQRNDELAVRSQQLTLEADQAAEQTAAWSAKNAAQTDSLAALRLEASTQSARLEELSSAAQSRATDVQQAESRVAALRATAAAAAEKLTQLHGEQRQAEEALLHHTEALRRLESSQSSLMDSAVRLRDDSSSAAAERDAASGTLMQLEQHSAALQAELSSLREQRKSTEAAAASLRDSLSALRARHHTLEQILNDRSYTGEAVKKLFAMPQGGAPGSGRDFRAVGLLADYAEVAQEHELAVEQFLRDELEYVVVETYDHARTGVALLREEVGGRATFFVDSLHKLKLAPAEPVRSFRLEDGVIGRLDQLVEFRNPLGPAAKQFLPRLATAFLTDTAATAEKLAREYPHYAFVLPDGTTYQGRMVSGGRPDQAGPLGMKRELRALEIEAEEFERQSAGTQSALADLLAKTAAAESSLEELSSKQREAERAVFAATHKFQQIQSDLARVSLDLTVCHQDLAQVQRDVDSSRQRASSAQQQHAAASATRASAESEAAQLAENLSALRLAIHSAQEELSSARAGQAALAERLSAAESLATRLLEERAEMDRRESALQQQLAAIAEEVQSLSQQSAELELQLTGLRAEKLRLESRQKELEAEWDSSRTRVTQTEDHLRSARQFLQDLREQRGHADVERARNDSDRQHLRETCLAEVNAHPEDLMASETALISGEELAAAESSYREMKSRIEAMGPVNMMALDEFNECDQRFTFLTRERDDLLQSIADTQQAIRELDEACRERFETAFNIINSNFSDAFHTIFGGGMAEMRLTEPDSSGDAGIDIVASPPGKRLQNVLLLSGGEKAMTALALLIAIFRYQPSPFCILDEVDAPLDEANVGRFTRLVDNMSSQTQFIIVTHNRRTMEMGSVLYGVTMQEPGVSKLVSVRWEGESAPAPRDTKKAAAASAA